MSTPIKVFVVSPTGRTGKSVVEGLLNSPTKFEVTALTRQSSLDSPVVKDFRERGVKVITANLKGPKKDLVDILTGIDVIVSCIYWLNLDDQIPLMEAAKEAGVKRFVPSSFMTAAPRGVMLLTEKKEEILAALQRAHMPWTIIDVGWWSNQIVPALPSGRTDKFVNPHMKTIPGDGTVPIAFTDLRDVGNYVARIITDPRTLNKKVLAYTEVSTMNQVAELMTELSGEDTVREYVPAEKMEQAIAAGLEDYKDEAKRDNARLVLALYQYMYSWGVRGDNNPEAAEIFGYLDFKKLYPDAKGKTIRELFKGILDGTEQTLEWNS
ncbi:isoflavone reductase family protein [Seiridium cupressi]